MTPIREMNPSQWHRETKRRLAEIIEEFLQQEANTVGGRSVQMEVSKVTPLQLQVKAWQPDAGPHYFLVKISGEY